MKSWRFFITGMSVVVMVGCGFTETRKGGVPMQINVTSPAFKDAGMIPSKYTCDGTNVSPPLNWSGVPEGSVSIALISDDPDAPVGTWVHWVAFNLPAGTQGLPEGVPVDEDIKGGGKQGVNDFGKIGYGGPCPPGGTHRYFFKVYALDTMLDLKGRVSKGQLLKEMGGHIVGEGQLMGKYKRD
jgi:Raf kinase inhibitor-like YbhB/YbcL family protein